VERGRVHRLHGRVVLVRERVDRLDLLCRVGNGLFHVALLVADEGLLGVEAALDELGDGRARGLAFGPSSQGAGRATSPGFACHQRSATTATALSPTFTTCLTPGMPFTLAASKLVSLPPNTGHSLIAAHSMPGSFRSMP